MLFFATGNKHKFQEISAIAAKYDIELRQHSMHLQEISSDNAKEIVLHKAKQAFAALKQPLIAEDTGFYFKAFRNFPGTAPKRVFESIGYNGIFKLLHAQNRQAYAQCTICFMEAPNSHRFFEGKLEGSITARIIKPKADVMPYERIFIPKGSKKVLAELNREEKNAISHRGIAARKLAEWLKERSLHELIETI